MQERDFPTIFLHVLLCKTPAELVVVVVLVQRQLPRRCNHFLVHGLGLAQIRPPIGDPAAPDPGETESM